MKKSNINPRPTFIGEYPPRVRTRTGHKVSWQTFATLEQAQSVSGYARQEGEWLASLGYDFGYCSPGEIEANDDGTYTVTFG